MFHAAILTLVLAAVPAEEKPLRVYFVGNSVTDTINYRALPELAKNRGHKHVCPTTPTTTKLPHTGDDGTTVERKTYGPGKNGAEVILFVINGGGHTWPGRKWPVPWLGKTTHDISANDLMWEFFKRHPMTDAEKQPETTTKETEAPTFDIKTRKVEDRVTATVEKDMAIFDATSRSGIGGATITTKGKWRRRSSSFASISVAWSS